MTASADSKPHQDRIWSVATWSAPFVIQAVLGAVIVVEWLLGKSSLAQHDTPAGERASLLVATGIAVVGSLVVAGVLRTRAAPVSRGIGIALAGSAAIVLTGGVGVILYLF